MYLYSLCIIGMRRAFRIRENADVLAGVAPHTHRLGAWLGAIYPVAEPGSRT
jgi:hypothetical protein